MPIISGFYFAWYKFSLSLRRALSVFPDRFRFNWPLRIVSCLRVLLESVFLCCFAKYFFIIIISFNNLFPWASFPHFPHQRQSGYIFFSSLYSISIPPTVFSEEPLFCGYLHLFSPFLSKSVLVCPKKHLVKRFCLHSDLAEPP